MLGICSLLVEQRISPDLRVERITYTYFHKRILTIEPRTIGEQILQHRLVKGWTQEQLAAFLGTALSTINEWESGRAYPAKFKPKIAGWMGLPVERLLKDKSPP